jgi:hypothetical protein
MATYLELSELVNKPSFRARIQYALWSCAVDVTNDALATIGAKNYARRSLKGSADPDKLMHLAIRCAANPTIAQAGEACADADIRFVVAASFTDLVD